MKAILLIFLSFLSLLLGCKSSPDNKEHTKTVFWYSSENEDLVLSGLKQWEKVGIKFKKGNPDFFQTVVIRYVSEKEMTSKEWLGEYSDHEIFINKDAKLNKKEKIHVIAHEFGHFLGLDHNNRSTSIMNINNPLTTTVSKEDIREAKEKWKKP